MSGSKTFRLWRYRLTVLQSIIALGLARIFVNSVKFSRWRGSLGSAHPQKDASVTGHTGHTSPEHLRAREIAFAVERAAGLLPFETKCLPRAVATQWILRQRGIPSELAIAIHRFERNGEDGYHAWVDHEGEMIIGRCERDDYRPVMVLSQSGAATLVHSDNRS